MNLHVPKKEFNFLKPNMKKYEYICYFDCDYFITKTHHVIHYIIPITHYNSFEYELFLQKAKEEKDTVFLLIFPFLYNSVL